MRHTATHPARYRPTEPGHCRVVDLMATAFGDALDAAQTAVTGYVTDAAPVVAGVAVLFLGIKYIRRIVGSL
jgi:hypothetical protein